MALPGFELTPSESPIREVSSSIAALEVVLPGNPKMHPDDTAG